MDLQQLITDINAKTSEENSEDIKKLTGQILNERKDLDSNLANLQTAKTTLEADLNTEKEKVTSLNHENAKNRWASKENIEKIDSLEAQLKKLDDDGIEDIDKLRSDIMEKDSSLQSLTKKLNRKSERDKKILTDELTAITDQDIIAKIEKVIPIKYDRKAKEPKFILDEVPNEDVDKTLDKIAELRLLGVLDPVKKPSTDSTPPHKKFNPSRYTADELENLADTNPKEYEKLRNQKGFYK
jgi:hypothetical protein